MTDGRRYMAFLIRLWSVHANGDLLWRASAENVHKGERHAFTDLAGLCDFLRAAVEENPFTTSPPGAVGQDEATGAG